jgi:GntR family transcriptional regulator
MAHMDVYDTHGLPRSRCATTCAYGDHVTIDPLGEIPVYLQLAGILREAIRSGEYPPGRPIPSLQQLTGGYGVARGTASKAVALLVAEGLVRIVPGKGAYVIKR